ncbi:MAG: hypothetical protein K2P84_06700, partial [Undibacterium sp.]|nr:hypothetical protein [Undibacterium sp.]
GKDGLLEAEQFKNFNRLPSFRGCRERGKRRKSFRIFHPILRHPRRSNGDPVVFVIEQKPLDSRQDHAGKTAYLRLNSSKILIAYQALEAVAKEVNGERVSEYFTPFYVIPEGLIGDPEVFVTEQKSLDSR